MVERKAAVVVGRGARVRCSHAARAPVPPPPIDLSRVEGPRASGKAERKAEALGNAPPQEEASQVLLSVELTAEAKGEQLA